MLFLVDAQLPAALARLLVTMGHDADHVGDLGLGSADDAVIWRRALRDGYVLITKDEDFAKRKTLAGGGPPVIWVRIPNTRRRVLVAWFPTVLPHIINALERGEQLVEVVRGMAD